MRKIQSDILDAILNKENFKSGHDEVVVSDAGNIQVLLHGSPIVRIENNEKNIFISLAKWNTSLTRGRINTVLNKYGVSTVSNKNRAPYLGKFEIPASGWVQVMANGYPIQAKPEVLQ